MIAIDHCTQLVQLCNENIILGSKRRAVIDLRRQFLVGDLSMFLRLNRFHSAKDAILMIVRSFPSSFKEVVGFSFQHIFLLVSIVLAPKTCF